SSGFDRAAQSRVFRYFDEHLRSLWITPETKVKTVRETANRNGSEWIFATGLNRVRYKIAVYDPPHRTAQRISGSFEAVMEFSFIAARGGTEVVLAIKFYKASIVWRLFGIQKQFRSRLMTVHRQFLNMAKQELEAAD